MIDIQLVDIELDGSKGLPEGILVRFQAKDANGFHLGKVGGLPSSVGNIKLSQTDAAKQPSQATDTTNNQEYLRFTRANKTSLDAQGINVDTWAGATGKVMTTVFVGKQTSLSVSKQFSWVKKVSGAFDNTSSANIYAPYNGGIIYYDVGNSSSGRVYTSAAAPNPTGVVNSYVLERNNTTAAIYQNGVSLPVTLTNLKDATLISGDTGTLRLGGAPDSETQFSDFDFYELIIYPRALTASEMARVFKYTEDTYHTSSKPHPASPSVKFVMGKGVTTVPNGRVSEIKDLVTGLTLKQDTVSKQPFLYTDRRINIPFIRFDASQQNNLFNAAADVSGWSAANNKAMTMLLVLVADRLDPQHPFSAEKIVSADITTEISAEVPDENGRASFICGNVLDGITISTNPIVNPTKTLNSFVYHKSGNTATIYQNGTLIATNTNSSGDAPTGNHAVSLGSSASPLGEFMSMDFYELQIYDKALSTSEMTALFEYVKHKYKME